jgi:four helix bundle protein
MDENLFKKRTKQLALRVIKVVDALPRNRTADVLGRQLIRSGTSIGANYRAACRGKSTADVIAKLRIVEEEADESAYWMELLNELPRSKLTGYQNIAMRIYPKGVTPECFNRGSSSGLAWIPDRSIRE